MMECVHAQHSADLILPRARLPHTQIFVKYKDAEAAKVCKDKIHGRLYGGQMVQVRLNPTFAFCCFVASVCIHTDCVGLCSAASRMCSRLCSMDDPGKHSLR